MRCLSSNFCPMISVSVLLSGSYLRKILDFFHSFYIFNWNLSVGRSHLFSLFIYLVTYLCQCWLKNICIILMLIIQYLSYCSNRSVFGHLEFLQVNSSSRMIYHQPFFQHFSSFSDSPRCASLTFCFLWSSPGINHFSKELWFLSLENSTYKPRLCHRACSWLPGYHSS